VAGYGGCVQVASERVGQKRMHVMVELAHAILKPRMFLCVSEE